MCVYFFPKARFGFAQCVQGCIWPSAPHCSPSNELDDESKQHRGGPRGHSLCVCVCALFCILTPICVACVCVSSGRASTAAASREEFQIGAQNCRRLPQRRPRGSLPFSKIHGYFKNISSFKLSCLDNLHYSSVSRLMALGQGAK